MPPIRPKISLLLVALQATTTLLIKVSGGGGGGGGGLLRGQAILQQQQQREQKNKAEPPFQTTFAVPLELLVKTASSSSTWTVNKDPLWDRKENILRDTYYYYEELVVSPSPTNDMCYGNMGRNGPRKHVWCHSQMPSVSLEPSQQPTVIMPPSDPVGHDSFPSLSLPQQPPLPSPAATPSVVTPQRHTATPSFSPTNVHVPHPTTTSNIGICEGDCNSPTDCAEGLYCFQRVNLEAVPGCPGTELDKSRTDYCTNVTTPPDDDIDSNDDDDNNDSSFRLKLYWNESYWWQGSNQEIEWCMACQPQDDGSGEPSVSCQQGDSLFLHYCSNEQFVVSFDFINGSNNRTILVHVVDSDELCLERQAPDTAGGSRSSSSVTLQVCNATNPFQNWLAGGDGAGEDIGPFEISPPSHPNATLLCLTIHHHPKLGEEIDMYPCAVARQDHSSFWESSYYYGRRLHTL